MTSRGKRDAIVEASAVLVGALVREGERNSWREIAVGGVYLDEVEAGGQGRDGRPRRSRR